MQDTTSDSDVQDLLSDIIFAYNKAVDAGTPPDREQLLQQHPDLAGELREFFADQDHCQKIRPAHADATPTLAFGSDNIAPAPPDRQFRDYELLDEIARGGMGVIYRARHRPLQRIVALKMILEGRLASREDVLRFQGEAEAVAQLDHPNIVPIYEVGEHAGRSFFAMKLIEGGSLAQALAAGRWPGNDRAAARLMVDVARAVHFAHQRGILHRDLKPGNILLSGQWSVASGQPGNQSTGSSLTTDHLPLTTGNEVPYVTDFGLAKRLEGDSDLTQSGAIVGTPAYMAPEQATPGRAVTTVSDVYSLGAILYEMLTGRKPFQGESPLATLLQVQTVEATSLRKLRGSVDLDLETICLKCLEKDPRRRYGSAEALADDLQRYLNGEPIQARPVTPAERAIKWVRKRPAIAGLLVLLGATFLAAFVLVSWKWLEADESRRVAEASQGEAENAQREAERAQREAERNAAEAEKQRIKAETERAKAEHNLKQLRMVRLATEEGMLHLLRSLYLSRLGRADVAYANGRLDLVRNFVANEKIGIKWEHDFLRRLALQGKTIPLDLPSIAVADSRTHMLACSLEDGRLVVVDLEDGKAKNSFLKAPPGTINSIAWHPDGKWFATAGQDGRVRLWDRIRGVEVHAWGDHAKPVRAVAFTTDGKSLISAGDDETVRVWNVESKKQQAMLKVGAPATALFVHDSRVALATDDGTIHLWDPTKEKAEHTIQSAGKNISSLVLRPPLVAWAANDGMVTLWDLDKNERRRSWQGLGFALDATGKRLALVRDRALQLIDADAGTILNEWPGRPWLVRFSTDGKTIEWLGRDRTWQTRDIANQIPWQAVVTDKGEVQAVALSEGRVAIVATDGTTRLWDVDNRREAWKRNVPGTCLAFGSEGKLLAVGSDDGKVTLVKSTTGETVRTIDGDRRAVTCIALRPGDEDIAIGYDDGTARLCGVDGREKRKWQTKNAVVSLAFDTKGDRILTADRASWSVRSAASGAPERQGQASLEWAGFLPEGQILLATKDRTIEILGKDKELRRHNVGHPLRSLAVSDDLVAVQTEGEIVLFDPAQGHEIFALRGPTGTHRGLAFRNGLIATGLGNRVIVWDGRAEKRRQ